MRNVPHGAHVSVLHREIHVNDSDVSGNHDDRFSVYRDGLSALCDALVSGGHLNVHVLKSDPCGHHGVLRYLVRGMQLDGAHDVHHHDAQRTQMYHYDVMYHDGLCVIIR